MAEPRDVSGWPSLQARPCRYPDPRPAEERRPYVYRGGCVLPLQRGRATTPGGLRVDSAEGPQPLCDWLRALDAAPLEERIPVLALGANAYPPQLREKLRGAPRPLQDDTVPVLGCVLRDAHIVFCAHLSRAGYIPVTARHRPGHAVAAWMQWFTAAQLPLIAATEGPRYRLVEIAQGGGALTLEGVATHPPRAYTWLHDALLDFGAGPLAFAGAPPSGHAPDPAGRLEVDLLREAIAHFVRAGAPADVWDGCCVPPARRDGLRRYLQAHSAPNPPAPQWTVVDTTEPGWAERLQGGG